MGFDRIEIGLGRVARMYQLKPEIMGGKGIIQMRPGIDPAAVLGQRWSTRLNDLGMISKDTFNVAMFAHPAQPRCFNYDIFERDEFFILNAEGLVRRTGQGQDGAMGEIACVAQATAITTGRLADYQYFNSIYGDYHSQVADAIRSLMAGDVASWNSFGQEIRALERPYYYPIQLIDLSGAHFDGLDLHGVDLSRTVLDWATFENVNLDDADVSTWEHLRVGIEFRGISQNDETKLGIV